MIDRETDAILNEIFQNFGTQNQSQIAIIPQPVQVPQEPLTSPLNDAITNLQNKLTELQKDSVGIENADEFFDGIVMELNQMSISIDDKLAAFNVIKNYQNNVCL